jgi:dCMP deaminase
MMKAYTQVFCEWVKDREYPAMWVYRTVGTKLVLARLTLMDVNREFRVILPTTLVHTPHVFETLEEAVRFVHKQSSEDKAHDGMSYNHAPLSLVPEGFKPLKVGQRWFRTKDTHEVVIVQDVKNPYENVYFIGQDQQLHKTNYDWFIESYQLLGGEISAVTLREELDDAWKKITDATPDAEGKWEYRFLAMARLIGSFSKDPSTKVGAVIVRPDKTIVSMGYNGFPKLMDDAPESYANRPEKLSKIIHAEENALIFANQSLEGCTMYTYPLPPCDRCCVKLIQAGIKHFVFPKLEGPAAERWAESVKLSKSYIEGCNLTYQEV